MAWPRSLKLNLFCESGTAQPCWLEDFGNGTVSSLAPPCPHSTQESHTASSGDQAIRGHEMGHSIEMLAHRPSALSFLLSASQGHSHLEYKSLPEATHPQRSWCDGKLTAVTPLRIQGQFSPRLPILPSPAQKRVPRGAAMRSQKTSSCDPGSSDGESLSRADTWGPGVESTSLGRLPGDSVEAAGPSTWALPVQLWDRSHQLGCGSHELEHPLEDSAGRQEVLLVVARL